MDFNQEDGNRPIPELMRPGFIMMSALRGFRARAVDLVWLRDRSDPHKNDAKQNNSSWRWTRSTLSWQDGDRNRHFIRWSSKECGSHLDRHENKVKVTATWQLMKWSSPTDDRKVDDCCNRFIKDMIRDVYPGFCVYERDWQEINKEYHGKNLKPKSCLGVEQQTCWRFLFILKYLSLLLVFLCNLAECLQTSLSFKGEKYSSNDKRLRFISLCLLVMNSLSLLCIVILDDRQAVCSFINVVQGNRTLDTDDELCTICPLRLYCRAGLVLVKLKDRAIGETNEKWSNIELLDTCQLAVVRLVLTFTGNGERC